MSIPASVNQADKTAYLEIPLGSLMTPSNITYDDILERHGGTGPIPDTKHLEVLVNDLKTLSELAETRGQACDSGMRELSSRRKERVEEEREREQASREAEEKESLKRAAEDDDDRKGEKVKRRKERSSVREDRPLAHGAHGLARQDGLDASPRGMSSNLLFTPKYPIVCIEIAHIALDLVLFPYEIVYIFSRVTSRGFTSVSPCPTDRLRDQTGCPADLKTGSTVTHQGIWI